MRASRDEPDEHGHASVADRLVAALGDGGELVDVGGFDIDATRALDKLAKFQLAEARAYILRWAEAGLIAGATQLRFDLDRDMVCVSFDRADQAVVISGPVLERLLTVLVGGKTALGGLPRELLAQLAVGVIAALGLEPVHDAEPGTRLCMREPFALGQRVDGAVGLRPEHELLRAHCRFSTTPVFLDNRRVSAGRSTADAQVLGAAPVVLDGETIGEARLEDSAEPAVAHLLARGLLIESLVLSDCAPGFVAVIDTPLPRDLTRAAIARPPELDVAMAAVYAVYRQFEPVARIALARRRAQGSELVPSKPELRMAMIISILVLIGLTVVALI